MGYLPKKEGAYPKKHSFPNVVRSCYLVFFFKKKNAKNKKKSGAFENLLPHISTTDAL